ncbi:MAG: hypothetical protein AB7X49_08850 [Geminicoccaceae bacterium]
MPSATRRDVLAHLAALPAAGLAAGWTRPARAGTGWGPGPQSGLPFWFGGYSDLDSLRTMMPAGRSLDLIGEFEGEGTYTYVASERTRGWPTKPWHKSYLLTGRSSAFQWTSSPFCSGASFVVPKSWPSSASAMNSGVHLNCCRPPTYTGNETLSEQAAKQRRVWQIAADGWMDGIWREKMLTFKSRYFIKTGLRDIRIVLRACHELNTSVRWGDRTYRRAYCMMLLNTVGDYQLVQEAMRRYFAVFLDVFGNTQASIPNDHAYGGDQLWPYWNTVKNHLGPVDVRLTCPDNAKLAGPDLYDHYGANLTDAIWDREVMRLSRQGWPIGLQRWLDWARSTGRPLALGEVGLMTKKFGPDGGRPPSDGWDNPVYITRLLDFCRANAADIAFISYFNRDNAASPDLPAHLIKPWPGIDSQAAACAVTPPGDNNRCGARAFQEWMAANA